MSRAVLVLYLLINSATNTQNSEWCRRLLFVIFFTFRRYLTVLNVALFLT
jgi:hypothetical protein